MPIRNIVLDIGNVVVPWDPDGIVRTALGDERMADPGFRSPLAGSAIWLAVNRGEHTLAEAKPMFVKEYQLTPAEVDRLYTSLMESMVLIEDSQALMHELVAAGYRLFAITDNVHEIVAHLKERHDFWPMFEHAAVSAELGVLKPDRRIYEHLLSAAALSPADCVFFDDVPANAAGAEAVGMVGRVFTDAAAARVDLAELGITL
ncbi:HAD family hydrolase [Parerythrobacter jejuensis]|uniref:HAD-IA family hydrolase n=1 Tax=Parerythrobacter jejuensis TaxID=795812 RepID=A0A845AQJ4_9SPHN|nr:HAD family phosphatase [Parerythrobacter jejuensis]MXP31165.1 HAD-IA family hydrolase [Parerythrobacter jejuensis]MXP33925.1 HAD-IA family hydrolase [Parerythrobacter jejuensis]